MRLVRGLSFSLLIVGALACSSTRVVQGQKTVAHQGDIYNLTSVTKISSRIETISPEGHSVSLKGVDKNQFETFVSDWGTLKATSYIDMDAQHMVYQTKSIQKHSELRRMERDLDSAMSSIQSFMKSKKSRQLNLK